MPRRGGRVREEGGSRGSWTVRQKETDAPLFLELRGFRVFSKQRRLSKYPQTPIKRTSFIRYGTNDTTLRYDFRSFVPLTAKSLVFVCRVVRDTTRFQRVARHDGCWIATASLYAYARKAIRLVRYLGERDSSQSVENRGDELYHRGNPIRRTITQRLISCRSGGIAREVRLIRRRNRSEARVNRGDCAAGWSKRDAEIRETSEPGPGVDN